MRQTQQNRRGRGRGRKAQNPLTKNYESNGPDVKIRGTAAHISEKYNSLARDALTSSDIVRGENYFQHAEHYNRIIMAAQENNEQSNNNDASSDEASNDAVDSGTHEARGNNNGSQRQDHRKNNNNNNRRRRPEHKGQRSGNGEDNHQNAKSNDSQDNQRNAPKKREQNNDGAKALGGGGHDVERPKPVESNTDDAAA